jgi:hypothetical protein
LIIVWKKAKVNGEPNKKHKRSNGDDFSTLTFAFVKFSSKIETMKMELQSQIIKEAMEVQKSIAKMAMEMK